MLSGSSGKDAKHAWRGSTDKAHFPDIWKSQPGHAGGFDAAVDYKIDDLRAALRQHAPDGVDVYFDNVGGDVLDAVLTRLARGARVVICGAVSQ